MPALPVVTTGKATAVTYQSATLTGTVNPEGKPTVYFFQIRSVGGAVADVPDDATAYAHRSANFSVVAFGASRARLDAAWVDLSAHYQGLYLSFETDQRPERITEAWPPATLARLRALKKQYDPENVFRDNFNITPDE